MKLGAHLAVDDGQSVHVIGSVLTVSGVCELDKCEATRAARMVVLDHVHVPYLAVLFSCAPKVVTPAQQMFSRVRAC